MTQNIRTGVTTIPAGGPGTLAVSGLGFSPRGIHFRSCNDRRKHFGIASSQATPPAMYYQEVQQDSTFGNNSKGTDAVLKGASYGAVTVNSMDVDGFTFGYAFQGSDRNIIWMAHD